jgi:glycosyltransferase involved in cell wall biosynthesis/peptidoglycan/xylan/chitin deacetylase (PgdA/CDA1 family)/SAM-dependent methyltransferase
VVTVSVVIPARNAESTLAETLGSLLAQTRNDWEALVVDDGSTDGTAEMARRHHARDPRIKLVSDGRESEGASAARNRGIAAARGHWLLFLDADDWIDPGFLQKTLAVLERTGGRVAFSACRRISPDGRAGPLWLSREVARAPFEVMARQCPVVIHGFVLDRALIDEIGGFDPELRTCEDWDFWHRLARTGVAFHPVPDAVAFYRLQQQSLSSDARQVLADGRRAVERAFSPDPRVHHPAPRHAQGADPGHGSREMAIGYFGLWCAAYDIGAGGDGQDLVGPLPDAWSNLAEGCRLTILGALRAGARRLPDEPLSDDPHFLARVRNLLQEVEQAANRPGFARILEFALEPEVFRPAALTQELAIGNVLLARRDLTQLATLAIPDGVDVLQIEFRRDGGTAGAVEVPVFASLSPRELARLAIDAVSLSVFMKTSGVLRRPWFWVQLPIAAVTTPPRAPRDYLKSVVRTAAMAAFGFAATASNDRALAAAIAAARSEAPSIDLPAARPGRPAASDAGPSGDRRAYWESVYATADPWAYGSPYEQLKYQRTLDLLPPAPIDRALEVACSEGWFTAMLAPRVGHLIASDISETALQRARARCAGRGSIEYRRLDFFDEPLPGDLDLLVCSEVLYDLADRAALERLAARLAAALKPGGHLLTAHAHLLKDDPRHTGFDWDGPFGAAVIAESFAATPGLALVRSLQTELYRIDLLRKADTAPAPRIDTVELGPAPEPPYARSIVWGGAEARRVEMYARERTERVPILNYHRIASDGPASLARYRTTPETFREQMRWLRRHGYRAVTSAELVGHLKSRQPLRGRPVMLTFDDGYRDFHDRAWPILQAHDFTAEVFVATDHVGDAARWDGGHGAPAALMGWHEIRDLAAEGIRFGSHMASHSHMSTLASRAIVREAALSRALIERVTGAPCEAIAAPFGEASDRFVRIAQRCGYRLGVTVEPGFAHLDGDPLRLPRIEVLGGWSLEQFADVLR